MKNLFEQYSPGEKQPFYWVIPGEIGGRCGPEMNMWNLDHLWDIGFRGIVSVHRLPEEEEEKVNRSDFNHLPLYFPAMALGRPGLKKKFLTLTEEYFEFMDEHQSQNKAVLTHCYAGLDRTSCLIGCYLISRYDYSVDRALDTIKEANPDAFMTPGYEETVKLYARNLDSES